MILMINDFNDQDNYERFDCDKHVCARNSSNYKNIRMSIRKNGWKESLTSNLVEELVNPCVYNGP